jgi:acetylornithine deacetylase/succinyl-diaminopimelate desuccinylase-like protein
MLHLAILLWKHYLRVYHEQTGLPAHDQVIGGGTYGRLMKRGVALGHYSQIHQTQCTKLMNLLCLDDLYRSISIYAQAIAEITNLD